MRRDAFLKTLVAWSVTGGLPLPALADVNLKLMIPANPGGGWDITGRALGRALHEVDGTAAVSFENRGGAAGAIGLAQFYNTSKGDPNALLVTGSVMLGGIITGKPPVSLTQVTPIARLTTEYNVFVVPESSPLRSMKEVVEQLKRDPGSIRWGGGSRGSTEHVAAALIAQVAGVDASKIQYVPFRGGGEAGAAILAGNVTVGGSGYSEFAPYIRSGRMRAIAVTAAQRLKGLDIPTLKEQGLNIEIGNWRGVYGAADITAAQRDALIDRVIQATRTQSWVQAVERNGWTPALLTGRAFEDFVARDFATLRAIMVKSGMV